MIDTGITYSPSAGEAFDEAALAVYGDERYTFLLLAANPDHCHKMRFDGTETLIIPEREEPQTAEQLPWKED